MKVICWLWKWCNGSNPPPKPRSFLLVEVFDEDLVSVGDIFTKGILEVKPLHEEYIATGELNDIEYHRLVVEAEEA